MMKNMSPNFGGGGKSDGKSGKPSYMSHLSDHQLSAHTPHSNSSDSMSHSNLMSKCGNMGNDD